MVTVDSANPLAVVYDILTLPFRTIAGLLGLPPLPSPFDAGASDGVLPPTHDDGVLPGFVPAPGWTQQEPGGPYVPPPITPTTLRPAPPVNNFATEMYLIWDQQQNYWFYITAHQYEFINETGGANAWEFAGVIPPGGTL